MHHIKNVYPDSDRVRELVSLEKSACGSGVVVGEDRALRSFTVLHSIEDA